MPETPPMDEWLEQARGIADQFDFDPRSGHGAAAQRTRLVRAIAAFGRQAAAKGREQMRERCLAVVDDEFEAEKMRALPTEDEPTS